MKLTSRQEMLLQFVKTSHGDQVRKYTCEPYWHHVVCVAEIVNEFCPDDFGLIEIAFCHDLFEDTSVTNDGLVKALQESGYEPVELLFITRGVLALTDVWTSDSHPYWNRSTRKSWEADRLGKIYKEYQSVKYADLIDNTRSIVEHDKGFAKKYLAEKRDILEVMRTGNLPLLIKCYNVLLDAESKLSLS